MQAQIASVDSDFGDVSICSIGFKLQKAKLDHSRIFKHFVDSQLLRDLSRCIKKGTRLGLPSPSKVVVTSARVNHVMKLEKFLMRQNQPRIRLLDSPSSPREWMSFAKLVGRIGVKPVIAMEVESSVIESREYVGGVIHVPSHYSLHKEEPSINTERKKIGIFWPVGRNYSPETVHILLQKTRLLSPIVKLPGGLDMNKFKSAYPTITFVPPGISNFEFREFLSHIKVALLAHENYVKQSSGYAGYFLANSVPILTSKTNSFFTELKKFGQLHAIENHEDDLSDFLVFLKDKPLSIYNNSYNNFTIESWKSFLL